MAAHRQSATAALCWLFGGLICVGLPLAGIVAAGHDPWPYLAFPPTTRQVEQAGFSWTWFVFFTIVDLILVGGLVGAVRCGYRRSVGRKRLRTSPCRMPWWGWAGLALCLSAWLLAWQRFAWFRIFQLHTFVPIWIGFILFVNAWCVQRSGSCPLLRRPKRFILLFPASAVFWWVFEYLNRFVQNWYYTGIEGMGPGTYSFLSSLAFATVLPGVLSMVDLLLTIPALGDGLARCAPRSLPAGRWIPLAGLISAGASLSLIGIFPDQLFALVWIAPLLIVLSVQALTGRTTLFDPLRRGDCRPLIVPAMAALICGFFWEMWNYFSLARWTYAIPYVQRFHLFEMPILGYGGYLPFGAACLLAGGTVIGNPFAADRRANP